jgi:hypothetical protein
MVRTRKDKIPLAGYKALPLLLEINRDALRALTKEGKKVYCKELITEIIRWSSYSPEEAIGVLEASKFSFLQMAESIRLNEVEIPKPDSMILFIK